MKITIETGIAINNLIKDLWVSANPEKARIFQNGFNLSKSKRLHRHVALDKDVFNNGTRYQFSITDDFAKKILQTIFDNLHTLLNKPLFELIKQEKFKSTCEAVEKIIKENDDYKNTELQYGIIRLFDITCIIGVYASGRYKHVVKTIAVRDNGILICDENETYDITHLALYSVNEIVEIIDKSNASDLAKLILIESIANNLD